MASPGFATVRVRAPGPRRDPGRFLHDEAREVIEMTLRMTSRTGDGTEVSDRDVRELGPAPPAA